MATNNPNIFGGFEVVLDERLRHLGAGVIEGNRLRLPPEVWERWKAATPDELDRMVRSFRVIGIEPPTYFTRF